MYERSDRRFIREAPADPFLHGARLTCAVRGAGRDCSRAQRRCGTLHHSGQPEILVIGATTARQGFAAPTLHIPVTPGALTLVFPEWLPGYHARHDPPADASQNRGSANGRSLARHRHAVISRTPAIFDQNNVNCRHDHPTAGVNRPPDRHYSRLVTQSTRAIPNDASFRA